MSTPTASAFPVSVVLSAEREDSGQASNGNEIALLTKTGTTNVDDAGVRKAGSAASSVIGNGGGRCTKCYATLLRLPTSSPIGRIPARYATPALCLLLLYLMLLALTGPGALPGSCVSAGKNASALEAAGMETNLTQPRGETCSGGNYFALYVLFVSALLCGMLATLARLPPLLGMMAVGFALRNLPAPLSLARYIHPDWSSLLRQLALATILLRAGLGLDPGTLRRVSGVALLLAFIPCLVETAAMGLVSHFLLGLPWAWAFMLGFVLGAVSPAVVVPSMLKLDLQGWGRDQGIPTLVIAAASLDDVVAITGFGVALAIAFSKTGIVVTLIKGPLEAVLGVAYGVVLGVVLWFLPHSGQNRVVAYRSILLCAGAVAALLGAKQADLPGAGPLACLSLAFVCNLGWRRQQRDSNSPPLSPNVTTVMETIWSIAQPFLFGLIGAEVNIEDIGGRQLGLGIACLVIALTFRLLATFAAVQGGRNMNMKERLFVPVAWLPKATVQAAIGPVALDTARQLGHLYAVGWGQEILTIAALSIIMTAPLGAVLIQLTAPHLLRLSSRSPGVLPIN